MVRRIYTVFCLLTLAVTVFGQDMQPTSTLVKRYEKDTQGFHAYPDEFLLAKIVPAIKFNKLEINTIWSVYRAKGDERSGYEYRNLYRYPDTDEKDRDTTALSENHYRKCFYTCWCPIGIPWYMSAQTIDNRIITIDDTTSMKRFLGNTTDKFNAFLWLFVNKLTLDIPFRTSASYRYKKITGGLLIKYRSLISAGPITTAVLTYYVDCNFNITLISTKKKKVRKRSVI